MGLAEHLKREEFNLRERVNVYSGMIIGLTAPTLFFKYIFCSGPNNMQNETYEWMVSLMAGAYFALLCLALGTVISYFGAKNLRNKRYENSRLEKIASTSSSESN